MNNPWFVSDLHIGHTNIIRYCNRPFESVEEMDQAIVNNWNRFVIETDVVYCLGDMAFHNYERLGELKGIKKLIPGNHDHEREKKIFPYFDEILDELSYVKVGDLKLVLCHYPLESWKRDCRYHLHGHSHGESRDVTRRMDVGIDATKLYRPIRLDEILEKIGV